MQALPPRGLGEVSYGLPSPRSMTLGGSARKGIWRGEEGLEMKKGSQRARRRIGGDEETSVKKGNERGFKENEEAPTTRYGLVMS